MPFKLNYNYYLYVSFKKDNNLCLKLKTTNELLAKLFKLMTFYQENHYHT